jgi:hypothetical protein
MKGAILALAGMLLSFMPNQTAVFSDLRASQNSSGIVIQWSMSQEDGIKYFSIEKASQVDNSFYQIGTVNATGPGSMYQYLDNSIYKTASSEIFKYQIVAVGNDGNTVATSKPISVVFDYYSTFTGVVKRTWGSIKAMFR